jgi:hypothetical protein
MASTRRRRNLRQPIKRKARNTQASPGQVKSIVHQILKSASELKYFDTYITTNSSTSTVGFSLLSLVPQGPAQSERIADTMWLQHMDLRFSADAANAAVFSHMRFFFFLWKENTLLAVPTSASIFTAAGSQSVYTMLDFENRALRKLVSPDYLLNFTGTLTTPTIHSQVDIVKRYPMHNARVDFTLGATTGINQLYFTNYSDQPAGVTAPSYQFLSRLWYYDEPH